MKLSWPWKRVIANLDGDSYMVRYFLVKTKWFGVYVHHILRSDEDRELHDHPWSFLSIILRGGYVEELPIKTLRSGTLTDRFVYLPGAVVIHRAEDAHRLDLFAGRTTWTLVFRGPDRREWGFHTDIGWMTWERYTEWKAAGGPLV